MVTPGHLPADLLTVANEQRVVFVEQLRLRGQGLHEQRLEGGVVVSCRADPEPGENAAGVGIDDKYRLVCCIEDDRIRRFRSYAVDGEKLCPEAVNIRTE